MRSPTAFRKAYSSMICTLLLASAGQADIRHVGNGGGASEQMLLYAFDQLPRLLETCKASALCAQNSDEQALLDALIQDHESETANGGLRFPALWTRSADLLYASEPRVGAAIEINVERLYDALSGYRVPTALPDSIEIVASALMEHHAGFEHGKARALAKRAGKIWSSQIRDINLAASAHPEISLMTIRSDAEPLGQSVLVGFGDGFTNISSPVATALPCPAGQKVTSLFLANLFWSAPEGDSARRSILLRVNSTLRFVCGDSEKADRGQVTGIGILEFKTNVKNGSVDAFLKDPSRFELVPTSQFPKVLLFDLH